MPRLLYLSLMRLPTEKAHGLQIMQNCEAFAQAGCDVELWVTRRWNTPEMRRIQDVFAYYGVEPRFTIRRVPVIDLMPLAMKQPLLERAAFYLHIVCYVIVLLLRIPFSRADIYYTRDEMLLLALSWLKPQEKLAYEAHLYSPTRRGARLQRQVVQRAGSTIAITAPLRDDLIAERGADPARVLVAHDGIRAARFAGLPGRDAARHAVGWEEDVFVVGFVGRLQMIGMDKGVGSLVEALAGLPDIALAVVGGPEDAAHALQQRWQQHDGEAGRFLYAGHVAPDQVPQYLSAFDACAMPHPATRQFARYTSPLKLFEYMAARRPIIASDLPGWRDVLRDGENALLVPPGDVQALRIAAVRLRDDPNLREMLADYAYVQVMQHHTWDARARAILQHIRRLHAQNRQSGGKTPDSADFPA